MSCQNVTKIFGKKVKLAKKLLREGASKEDIVAKTKTTIAVDNVSFDIYEGEIFVIMGLSGSGKSTMLRLMNRLIEPTDGDIVVNGQSVFKAKKKELLQIRRNVYSMVFQGFGLFPHKTILENTEFGLELKGVDKESRVLKAELALENAGLLAYKDQYPNQLSGGMQQRVGLARALANDPEILLMDEAFSALDPLNRKDMQDELIHLQETLHKTIIFITHDLNEALRIGDRIAIMRDGKLVQVGTGEEILMNPVNRYVERFVEDVDRTKVLTISHIMEKPQCYLNVDRKERGMRYALNMMKEENFTNLIVINNTHQAVGYIELDDLVDLIHKKGFPGHYEEIIRTDIPRIQKDSVVDDVYGLLKLSKSPIVVEDENCKMVGVVTRKRVIEMLDSQEEFNV
ncbi:quaternary amine ABC transporter ATP-binding protein [Granulicatella balaenopterae]|uniref:quaternary amine ABC transporter ATP-binding protein n=1 Tax=Granulicatella balaenopterae TaxID=137733 RepID=UPI001FE1C52D|nr:glycine betaine/L-proline ABC transporter ATP-binding protein [Granulicatella balaenopterae]